MKEMCLTGYLLYDKKKSTDSVVLEVNSAGKLSEASATQLQSAKVSFNQFQIFT